MDDSDVFRQDLAASLLACAERRRAAAGQTPTGEDIKILALLERLAADLTTLDAQLFRTLIGKGARRRAAGRSDAWLQQLGVLYCPSSGTDLVRWLATQSPDEGRQDHAPSAGAKMTPAAVSLRRTPRWRRDPPTTPAQGLLRTFASDFSAGLGIVAPMLSLWNVRLAVGQLQDRAFAAGHASVPATVVSVTSVGAGRGFGSSPDVVLAFRSASGEACRVTWHPGLSSVSANAGETLPVVPRPSGCAMPVIPTSIGDPLQSFALAGVLMAVGLVSIKVWAGLFRRAAGPARSTGWLPTVLRGHDLA